MLRAALLRSGQVAAAVTSSSLLVSSAWADDSDAFKKELKVCFDFEQYDIGLNLFPPCISAVCCTGRNPRSHHHQEGERVPDGDEDCVAQRGDL
jgi:hypothetical protein